MVGKQWPGWATVGRRNSGQGPRGNSGWEEGRNEMERMEPVQKSNKNIYNFRERESRLTAGAMSARAGREAERKAEHHQSSRAAFDCAVNHYGRHLIDERCMSARQK
jgi:hypothetical protein